LRAEFAILATGEHEAADAGRVAQLGNGRPARFWCETDQLGCRLSEDVNIWICRRRALMPAHELDPDSESSQANQPTPDVRLPSVGRRVRELVVDDCQSETADPVGDALII